MKQFFLLLGLLAASGSSFSQSSTFIAEGPYVGGAALIEPANGGEYVYGEAKPDTRKKTRPMVIGAVPRQSYVFLSADEEQALLAFRDKQLAEQVKAKVINDRRTHQKRTKKLNWPKVVLQDDQVCVPELASADALDWKEHLTCYSLNGKGN